MVMKIYLAGAFGPSRGFKDWRDYVIKELAGRHQVIDPRYDSKQESPMEFTIDDTLASINCDLMFHYRSPGFENNGGDYEHGVRVGSHYASELTKPIVLVDESQFPHPLFMASAKRFFTTLEAGVLYLTQ